MPFLIGAGVLVILYVFFYVIWSGNWNPADLVVGQDKRPSTSKFQFLLWTVVVVYSYVVIYAARACHQYFAAIDQIPPNLLIAMGLSIVTVTAAKGITVGYLDAGRIVKPEPPATQPDPSKNLAGKELKKHSGWSSILVDDSGYPDLSKIQMIAWTFIAIAVYIIGLVALVNNFPESFKYKDGHAITWSQLTPTLLEKNPDIANAISLPDISAALMVLMGLGQGAYLGKKLVSANTARLTQLSPTAGKPGTEITISGVSFSEAADGNQVTLDGKPQEPPATVVTASQIKFVFPQRQPDGTAWTPGEVVAIGAISGGQDSANTLPFTVTLPVLNKLSANQGAAGSQVTLLGSAFGAAQGSSRVLIDGAPYTDTILPADWQDDKIKITIPTALTAGPHQLRVSVDGQLQTNALAFTVG